MIIDIYLDLIMRANFFIFVQKESVDLALNLLDGYDVRGKKIKVEKARFTMKGNSYDPNLKPKKKRRKDKEKLKKMQEK